MSLVLKTRVIAALTDENGLVEKRFSENFFTETGEALIADRLSDRDDAGGDFSHMAIGTGGGQTRTDTALDAEVARVALTTLDQGSGADDNDVVMVATFAAGTPATNVTVTELAIFNEAVAGTMLNYVTFSPGYYKTTSQSLQFTVVISVGTS